MPPQRLRAPTPGLTGWPAWSGAPHALTQPGRTHPRGSSAHPWSRGTVPSCRVLAWALFSWSASHLAQVEPPALDGPQVPSQHCPRPGFLLGVVHMWPPQHPEQPRALLLSVRVPLGVERCCV